MRKFYKSILGVMCSVFLITGCGSREKKSIAGVLASGSEYTSSTTSDEMTTSISSMFSGMKTSGTGTTSAKRTGSLLASSVSKSLGLTTQSVSLVGSNMPGLGESDSTDGHYTISAGSGTGPNDPTGTGKLWFLTSFGADRTNKSNVLYMVIPSGTSLIAYDAKNVNTGNAVTVGSTLFPFTTYYLPSMWRKLSDNNPQSSGWLSLSLSTASTIQAQVNDFFNNWANYGGPKGIAIVMDMICPVGNKVHQEMNMEMREGPPTSANPAHVIGTGYMITTKGEKMTMTMDAYIGDNGPISGTMTLTIYTGHVATITYNSDGSMTGVVKDKNGKQVGTIKINADGTGTFTDANGTHDIKG